MYSLSKANPKNSILSVKNPIFVPLTLMKQHLLLMLKRLLNTNLASNKADVGILILRIGISFFMIHHGYDKLQTLLSGGGADFPDPLHIGNKTSLSLTVFAEFLGSLLLIVGFLTRFALISLIICMRVVIFVIHANDPLADKEHAYLFLIPYITIFFTGAGKYSVDAKVFG